MLWTSESIASDLGATRDGIVTTALLAKVGVNAAAFARLRRRGVIVPLGRGVGRLRDHPFTWRSQCRAALDMAGDSSALGLSSAARMHSFYAYRERPDVVVVSRRNTEHGPSIGRLVRSRWLPPEHVIDLDGFPVTTMARTFFDLCANPDPGLWYRHRYHERRMRQVYNDALGRRGMTFTQEAAVLLVLARRGRRGTTLTRNILLQYGPQHRPTRSDTETLFLEFVRTYGLTEPEVQAVISGPRGFIGTVDFAWRAAKLVVEVDSSWHDGPLDREVDEERDGLLRELGNTVKRYRYGDIVDHPGRLHRELGLLIAGKPSITSPDS